MAAKKRITRRRAMKVTMAGASGAVGAAMVPAGRGGECLAADAKAAGAKAAEARVQGPFLILSTPFTEKGAVDFDVLVKAARFMDWCGSPGMIWPQSGDSVDLLTTKEKLEGMEALAAAARGMRTALCLGVQGKDTAEMLMYAKHVEKLQPTAIISRPPDAGKTQDDMRQYWRALAGVAKRPVIIQTTGGTAYKGPVPSTALLIELAKEYPQFGYVKEEAGGVIARMRALLAARPPIRRVFGARGAYGWLHELHLGAEGLITERAVFSDLIAKIWRLHQSGSDAAAMTGAYSKLLLMMNISQTVPGGTLRGFQLYLWRKRGVFKNMISRHYGPKRSVPTSPRFSELKLSKDDIAEIEFRFAALKGHLKPGAPDFAKPS